MALCLSGNSLLMFIDTTCSVVKCGLLTSALILRTGIASYSRNHSEQFGFGSVRCQEVGSRYKHILKLNLEMPIWKVGCFQRNWSVMTVVHVYVILKT